MMSRLNFPLLVPFWNGINSKSRGGESVVVGLFNGF